MNRRPALLLPVLASSLFAACVQAADHLDAPAVMADPSADLNDFYSFVNPNDANEVISILTVHPLATGASQFSDAVIYDVWFSADADAGVAVQCRFDAEQRINCTGPGGATASGNTGNIIDGDGMRVWAGLTDDPFFFDLTAFRATVASGVPAFTDPGTDFFAGLNTLAIVVGIDKDRVDDGGPIQKTFVSSARVGGTGITEDVQGFWWNNTAGGRGWHFDVFTIPETGERQLGAAYYGFNDSSSRLWLVGAGPITGNTATFDVIQGSNGTFAGAQPAVATSTAGTVTVEFTSCSTATVSFTPAGGVNLPASEFELNDRPASDAQACQFFADTGQSDTFGKAHLAFQKDRNGRPAIATALIPAGMKDAYNMAADPTTWVAQFADEMEASLTVFDGLDGIEGNLLLGSEATLAGVLADDRLVIDTSVATCGPYLAVELAGGAQAAACGGRVLAVDVIDATLSAAVGSAVSDNVDANDKPFRDDFPFLAPPN